MPLYFICIVGFKLYYSDFSVIFGPILEIVGPFWGILGPFLGQILGGSWEMVTYFRSI
jgi:hypothetical protein